MGTQPGCSREIASLFAEEIIRLVGHKRTDRILLVGSEHIELLVELLHHGFTEVTCRTALAGPGAGELAADICVIPAAEREPDFAAVLARLGRALRLDGVLLTGAAASPFTRIRAIHQALHHSGFGLVRRRLEPVHVHLLYCRKLPLTQPKAA